MLFFGHAQLVAEGLLVIGGVYCLLWVPLMDSFLALLILGVLRFELTGWFWGFRGGFERVCRSRIDRDCM